MSVRRLSPTANLLRSSRLFALPSQLPRPVTSETFGSANIDSDTATAPYPTHPAIETSERSLARGDWGLKRPLPLKSTTRSSAPVIRIDNVDSIDFITDFGSAADHSRTLAKWQEIDMPMSTMSRERKSMNKLKPLQSVFEADVDSTANKSKDGDARWKFEGPWLAGFEEGEFNEYLKRKVGKRKSEFKAFLHQRFARVQQSARRREQLESGADADASPNATQTDPESTDAALDQYIRGLRADEDAMQQLVNEFLDLPRERQSGPSSMGRMGYNDKGPPSMHPSGGLSYLRTASHMFNHPLHGPQDDKSPIQARVLIPQVEYGMPRKKATFGVAGVVAEDVVQPFTSNDENAAVRIFDPDVEGGGKVLIEAKRASLDTDGHIQLETKRAERNAITIMLTDKGEMNDNLGSSADASPASFEQDSSHKRNGAGSGSQSYGIEDLGGLPRQRKATPINERSDKDTWSLLGKILQGGNK